MPLLAGLTLATSCSKYDDTALTSRVTTVEWRMDKLEELVKTMNGDIHSLRNLASALEAKDFVKQVETITEGGRSGYRIHFTKSPAITIFHGEKGTDGKTPIIGIQQHEGVYYWTLNGQWLTDGSGAKIKAQGLDGAEAKTPKLRIEQDKWEISYDNGQSWTPLNAVARGAQGEQGAPGPKGADVVNYFSSVITKESEVVLTLTDGTVITLPRVDALGLNFVDADKIALFPKQTVRIAYTAKGLSDKNSIQVMVQGGYTAKVVPQSLSAGTIEITTPDKITEAELLVVLSDERGYSRVYALMLHEGILKPSNGTYLAEKAGFTLEVPVTTNTQFTVEVEPGIDWVAQEGARALATRTETLRFVVKPNEGSSARSASVRLMNGSTLVESFVIVQKGDKELVAGLPGKLEQQFAGKALPEELHLAGTLDAADLRFLRANSAAIRVLDLSQLDMSTLPEEAFAYTSFGTVILPKKLTHIPTKLFFASHIEHAVLPEGLVEIGESAFRGCAELRSAQLPAQLKRIKNSAFTGCTNLSDELSLPSTLTELGEAAFASCINLSGSIVIPESIRDIQRAVFHNCNSLNGSLTLPAGLRSIGDFAFAYNSSLTGDLVIPEGVRDIGEAAFAGLGATGTLTLPKSLRTIKTNAFSRSHLTGTLSIPEGVQEIQSYAFTSSKFTSLSLPNTLRTIERDAFNGAQDLAGQLVLPASLRTIGERSFGATAIESVAISEGLTRIGQMAFYNCRNLQEVNIPSSVEAVEAAAFANCRSLQSVQIQSMTEQWGGFVFENCSSLPVTFPQGLTTLPVGFFKGCRVEGEDLSIPHQIRSIQNQALANISGLRRLFISQGVESIDVNAFSGNRTLTDIYIDRTSAPWIQRASNPVRSYYNIWVPQEAYDSYQSDYNSWESIGRVQVYQQ